MMSLDLGLVPADAGAGDLLAALHAVAIDDPWDAQSMATLLAGPGVDAIVALEAGEPIGFVMLRAVAGEAEILTLAVLPAARRRGVGAALMRAAITGATAADARRLFLEVAEDNLAAVALYVGLGFTRVGRRPSYYRRPEGPAVAALILARDLAT